MAAHRITAEDLDRWVREGLITAEQRSAILRDLEARQPEAAGLTITNLLYYGGGLLVLLAYSIFLGLQWENLDAGGRIVIAILSLVFFAAVSTALLRVERFRLPAELLQVVAVAIMPLLMFALLDATGVWPEDLGYSPTLAQQYDYQTDTALARMAIAGATLLAGAGAFSLSRSPFVLIAALIAVGSLVLDLTLLAERDRTAYDLGTPQAVTLALQGAGAFGLGVLLRGRTARNYSIWLYLLGLAAMAQGLGFKAFEEEAAIGWGILWLLVALAVAALSVPLQERLLAGIGLAGVFAYLARLVFEVFESAAAALVLAAIGLLVLGVGMAYQRYAPRLFPSEERGRGIT